MTLQEFRLYWILSYRWFLSGEIIANYNHLEEYKGFTLALQGEEDAHKQKSS